MRMGSGHRKRQKRQLPEKQTVMQKKEHRNDEGNI